MNKIVIKENKTLKLNNVIKYYTSFEEENLNTVIEKIQGYIKINGKKQIGPLNQYTKPVINSDNEIKVELIIMIQCDSYLHNNNKEFMVIPVMKSENCLYCRYTGPEEKIKFAYDKLHVEAFENDIELTGGSYTVFVDKKDDNIIADVFMERAD